MGMHLRPGHKLEDGKKGWVPTNYDILIEEIKIGQLDLGHWGPDIKGNIDKYSPLYSIPNPWAAAYLYYFVLRDNTHPLVEPLLKNLINLLYDISIFKKVELLEIQKPKENEPFYKFWQMAPDFIKYYEKIFVFINKSSKNVEGGLSKSTLLWTSQQYKCSDNTDYIEKDYIIRDEKIKYLLKHIKNCNKPDYTNEIFNIFWQHEILSQIISSIDTHTQDNIGEKEFPNAPEDWLIIIESKQINSKFFDEKTNMLVFDSTSLNRNEKIFDDRDNPPSLINELIEKKSGDSLPLNLGDKKWVILDYLFEKSLIKQNKFIEDYSNQIKLISNEFLYPVKSDFIERFKLNLSDLSIDRKIFTSPQFAKGTFKWNNKLNVDINCNILNDSRSLAVWPPFQSKYSNIYIFEYYLDGVNELEKLEFYDKDGNKINFTQIRYFEGQNFRVYELNKKFPKYIRINIKNDSEIIGGFLEIEEKIINKKTGKVTVGIDFGTTHTTIALKANDSKSSLLNFKESKPIFLADKESIYGIKYNFLPNGFDEKPLRKEQWENRTPWQPVQTLWMKFANNQINSDEMMPFLDGIIPFLHYASNFTIKNPIENNLKWGVKKDIASYRELFLKQIILMSIVEAEAMGFEEIDIRWSYPVAFSPKEYQILKGFWENIKDKLKINN